MIRISKTKFSMLNDTYVTLITIDDQLDTLSTMYFMNKISNGTPLNTISTDASVIKLFYEFCLKNKIDFHKNFAGMIHLKPNEINSLVEYMRYRKDNDDIVTAGTFKSRISIIRNYITSIWNFYFQRINDVSSNELAIHNFKKMEIAFEEYAKSRHKKSTKDKKGLEPNLKHKFLDIISPLEDNELNPWKNNLVKWRNYCLFLTMILGGNRKGESMNLKLKDFYLTGPETTQKYFEFEAIDTINEKYGRKVKPAFKTKGRRVVISNELAKIFEYYITKIRPQFKNSKKNDYVFLSLRDGLPISINTPNEALKILISKYPEYENKLSPHILRNTFADSMHDVLSNKLSSENNLMKQNKINTALEYSFGWSKGSDMVNKYPIGSIERRVAEMTVSLHDNYLLKDKE